MALSNGVNDGEVLIKSWFLVLIIISEAIHIVKVPLLRHDYWRVWHLLSTLLGNIFAYKHQLVRDSFEGILEQISLVASSCLENGLFDPIVLVVGKTSFFKISLHFHILIVLSIIKI